MTYRSTIPLGRLWGLLLLLAGCLSAQAQVTVVIDKVPSNTPSQDKLFITGAFNNWQPGDSAYAFRKLPNGTYSYTFPNETKPFEFKITRGSWANVEGDIRGGKLGNRLIGNFRKTPYTQYIQILSWEDLARAYSWDIIVKTLPENTPFDATIFVSGNFNGWAENDPNYRLTRLEDGSYGIKITRGLEDSLWFKFNRGSWKAAECRKNGRPAHDHLVLWQKGAVNMPIYVNIEAWEDMGGGRNLFLMIVLLMAAAQGAILAVGVLSTKNRDARLSWPLVLLSLTVGFGLLCRLAVYDREIFDFEPKLYLLSDVLYVLAAPLTYLLVRSVMGLTLFRQSTLIYFAGGILGLFALYLSLLVVPRDAFVHNVLNQHYDSLFMLTSGLAALFNLGGFVFTFRLLNKENHSLLRDGQYQEAREYSTLVLAVSAVSLLVWLFAVSVYSIESLFHYDASPLLETITDILWSTLALGVYAHSFLYMRYTGLFRKEAATPAEAAIQATQHKEDLEELKAQLDALLEKGKPYLNPKLTLEELADRMHINLHTLSWLINEGYGKNFFDLINEKRIEEFIRLSTLDKYKNYTFLAIAMEAGFNSKTTFNRVFKKHTGKTPREYFGVVQDA